MSQEWYDTEIFCPNCEQQTDDLSARICPHCVERLAELGYKRFDDFFPQALDAVIEAGKLRGRLESIAVIVGKNT